MSGMIQRTVPSAVFGVGMGGFALTGSPKVTPEPKWRHGKEKTALATPTEATLWDLEPEYPPVSLETLKRELMAAFVRDRDGIIDTQGGKRTQSDGWLNSDSAAIRLSPSISDARFAEADPEARDNEAWYYVAVALKSLALDGLLTEGLAPVYGRSGQANRYTGEGYHEYVGDELVYGFPGTPARAARREEADVRG